MNAPLIRLFKLLVSPIYVIVYVVGFFIGLIATMVLMLYNYITCGEAKGDQAEDICLDTFIRFMRNFY